MRRMSLLAVGAVGALAASTAVAQPAVALDDVNSKKLRNAVTVNGILGHERAFQRIANQNGGTRASGTPGYAASAAYVGDTLKKAGYKVTTQEFTFPFYRDLAPPAVSQVTPTPTDYATATFTYSGSGDVTGPLVPTTDVQVPPGPTPSSSSSGCEASDFPAAPAAPAVALAQRGTCTFEVKRDNAAAAGYEALIIFNEGQPGRTDLLTGTLGTPGSLPVVGLSYADGAALVTAARAGAVTVNVATSTETNLAAKTTNVFAETKGGNANEVVVVGAHLDSVVAGPGINDNGSGSAQDLEIAVQLAKLNLVPKRKIRFAFWGAEENGLLGSTYYVDNLPDAELTKIYANLNFDMVGSPNYVRFVYDGDASDFPAPAGGIPPGSAEIETVFTDYFAGQGLASAPTEFSGRSDYGPFIAVGIPAGGLFSGAEGIKTPAEAAVYGGTAGVAYDKCYHQACDNISNLNTKALNEFSDAAAHAVWTLAKSRSGLFPDGSLAAATKQSAAKKAPAKLPAKGHLATR